jgi:hypothetical protein
MNESSFEEGGVDAIGSSAVLPNDRMQLRLQHIFVLTAVMAAMLAVNGPMQASNSDFQPSGLMLVFWFTAGTLHTLLSAAALTILGYGIAWYRRGMRFFDQPGHWLLVDISLGALLQLVPVIAFRLGAWPLAMIFGFGFLFFVLARMVFLVYLGIKKCRERRWKNVFYLMALSMLLYGLGNLFVLIAIFFAARTDRRTQAVRDQAHRCGVWLESASSALSLLFGAFTLFSMFGWF